MYPSIYMYLQGLIYPMCCRTSSINSQQYNSEAQLECPHGHALSAFSARPPDYRKFDGSPRQATYEKRVCSMHQGVFMNVVPSEFA